MKFVTIGAAALVMMAADCAVADADPALLADLEAVEVEIGEAEAALANSGGAIGDMIRMRLETLKTTRALIDQRILAEESGATLDMSVPASVPDEKRAQSLLEEIFTAKQELDRLKAEAAGKGGLQAAMADLSVATQEQALTLLRLGYYAAKYGLPMGFSPDEGKSSTTGTAQASASPGSAPVSAPDQPAVLTKPDWADTRYPDIDYSGTVYTAAANQGMALSGRWAISETRSPLDDSPVVMGINFDPVSFDTFGDPLALSVTCKEGETALRFSPGAYLLPGYGDVLMDIEYRIGDGEPERGLWSITVDNEQVGLWGEKAIDFLRRIKDEDSFYIRVTERQGERHDGEFDLRGLDRVIEKVSDACGWFIADLSADDLKAIQSALKQAGYYKGAIDGQWGPGSRAALMKYQESFGLRQTGSLNAETMRSLGYTDDLAGSES